MWKKITFNPSKLKQSASDQNKCQSKQCFRTYILHIVWACIDLLLTAWFQLNAPTMARGKQGPSSKPVFVVARRLSVQWDVKSKHRPGTTHSNTLHFEASRQISQKIANDMFQHFHRTKWSESSQGNPQTHKQTVTSQNTDCLSQNRHMWQGAEDLGGLQTPDHAYKMLNPTNNKPINPWKQRAGACTRTHWRPLPYKDK